MKKTLALVLALLMLFSCMTVMASATSYEDYTDAAEADASDYAEAIDVVVGLGIIKGMTETELGLDGTLTRAQAAKILAYLTAGSKTADKLACVADPFDDVTADFWAAGYIAYGVSEGYLAGVGDNLFAPNDELTGYAFCKMLLNALGYGLSEKIVDMNTETVNKYVGSGWDIKVAVDVASNGLDKDLAKGVDLSAAITRDVAFQLIFNTLKNWTVADNAVDATENPGNGKFYALVADYEIEAVVDSDDFGLTSHEWKLASKADDKTFTAAYVEDELVGTYAGGTKYVDIASDLGITSKSKATYSVISNGDFNGTDTAPLAAKDLVADKNAKLPYGVNAEVYEDANDNYKVVLRIYYLAKVTKVTAGKNDDAGFDAVNISWYNKSTTASTFTLDIATYEITTGTYAKDDYILVAPEGDAASPASMIDIIDVDTVEGKITSMATDYLKIDGVQYYKVSGGNFGDWLGAGALGYASTYTFFLAPDGSVITYAVKEEVVDSDQVFVVGYYAVAVKGTTDSYGQTSGAATEYYAQVVDANSVEQNYLVAIDADDEDDDDNLTANSGLTIGDKTPDWTDVYAVKTLKAPTGKSDCYTVAAIDTDFARGFTVGSKTETSAVSSSVRLYYSGAKFISVAGKLDKLEIVTGSQKKAAELNEGAAFGLYAKLKSGATTTTVDTVFYTGETTVSSEYIYSMFVFNGFNTDGTLKAVNYKETRQATLKDGTKANVYSYEVYLNGVKTTIETKTSSLVADFYEYYVDEDGLYVMNEIDGSIAKAVTFYQGYLTGTGVDSESFVDFNTADSVIVDLMKEDDNNDKAANDTIDKDEYVAFFAYPKAGEDGILDSTKGTTNDIDVDEMVVDAIYIIDYIAPAVN